MNSLIPDTDDIEQEPARGELSELLQATRVDLLKRLNEDRVLKADALTEFEIGFSGYGDSGDVDELSGDTEADEFLKAVMNEHVHFDWYNNDGGGGRITWDIIKDEIVINGYQNETVQRDIMEGFQV